MAVTPSVGIIGAGLGGLAASIYLARAGYRVKVYEKNEYPGGKAGSIEGNGFRFDTGPSLLTMPFVLRDLFAAAGETIEDHLTLQKLDILCTYFYPDGTVINAHADRDALGEEIARVSDDSSEQLKRYLHYCERIYRRTAELFLFQDFRQVRNLLTRSALRTLGAIYQIDPFRTMHNANASFFRDPRIIQLFDRYATYNGSNPYKAPATLNVIQHVEYNLGGYIVKEGIHQIPRALHAIASKLGVEFYFQTPVTEILSHKGSVRGLRTDTFTREFDCIISNVDAGFTYVNLLGNQTTPDARRYFRQEPSSSAIVFYWGMQGKTEALETHNVFFSKDYETEFDAIFQKHVCPDDPTIYVYISQRFRQEDAPPECENWFVMVNTPWNTGQDWDEAIRRMRKSVIEKLSGALKREIAGNIRFEEILSPVSLEQQTGSLRGSLYGISSNSRYAAFLRQPIKSNDYRHLYFCGGSAHPGGGIPLVLLSGKLAAERVLDDYGR